MDSKETRLILSFLEECQLHDTHYAEMRLWQRRQYARYHLDDISKAAATVSWQIERRYRTYYRFYQLFVIGGIISVPLFLAAIMGNRAAYGMKVLFCCSFAAAIIYVKVNFEFLRENRRRYHLHRQDMAAFINAFGGLLDCGIDPSRKDNGELYGRRK